MLPRDLSGRESFRHTDEGNDGTIGRIKRHRLHLRGAQGYAEAKSDLLEHRGGESCITAGRDHSLHTAAPLLHQAKFVEYPSDHAIAQLRDAEGKVGNCEAEGEESWALDL